MVRLGSGCGVSVAYNRITWAWPIITLYLSDCIIKSQNCPNIVPSC